MYMQGDVETEVLPREGAGRPTRVKVSGKPLESMRGYPYPLNLYLVWSDAAVIELVTRSMEQEFARYLDALPNKMSELQASRGVDFGSRTQSELAILVNDLDFDA
nr:DUF5594 family protein [Burkholderia thailandensis]